MYYLGIDLGGIHTVAAVTDEEGTIFSKATTATPKGAQAVADAIAAVARQAIARGGLTLGEITAIGMGAPGTIDPRGGYVERWSKMDFSHVPLSAMVEQRLGRPIALENDANAAALGEYVAGAGRGCASLIAITLGTGVGGGGVLGGTLYTGANYGGMEVGHMVIAHGGRRCSCGRQGCFEAYASATALMQRTREAMAAHRESLLWQLAGGKLEAVDGALAFAASAAGDSAATLVVEEYLEYLACGVINLVNLFQPERLCIGGGVSNAGAALLRPVQAALDREDYAKNSTPRTALCLAQLGGDAGVVGAALLSLFRQRAE